MSTLEARINGTCIDFPAKFLWSRATRDFAGESGALADNLTLIHALFTDWATLIFMLPLIPHRDHLANGLPFIASCRYLNVERLVSWLASRQYAPEGGFSGRTNKLVDGCYSHWVGDCWPLVEAYLERSSKSSRHRFPSPLQSLFSREGLIRYILCCCQDQTKRGGLRDKPGRYEPALCLISLCGYFQLS